MLTTLLVYSLASLGAAFGAVSLAHRFAPEGRLRTLFSCPLCLSYWTAAVLVLASDARLVDAPAPVALFTTWLAAAAGALLLLRSTGTGADIGESVRISRQLAEARADARRARAEAEMAKDELRAIAEGEPS